jgi:hypothetical protein
MASGRSGLAKLRLSVTARGFPPTAVMLRQDRLASALDGVGLAVARRHVGGERQALRAVLDPHDRRVAARGLHRVAEDEVVVLLPDPALRAQVRRAREPLQRLRVGDRRRDALGRDHGLEGVGEVRPVVDRGLVAELLDRQVGDDLAPVLHHETQCICGLADDREVEPPLAEDILGLRLHAGLEDHEHALLAFREHHLVSRHALFPRRHLVEVELDPKVALRPHLDRRAGEARRAHVLDRDDRSRLHQLEAGLQKELLGEGISDLHGRALLRGRVVELGRGHGGAVDAVAAGLRAEIDDRVPDAGRGGIKNRVLAGEADRHGVDQDVAVVALVEADRTADRRYAEGIAVAADAGDDARHEMARLGMGGRAEAQRVQGRDRPRAHGEHVPENPADSRRRTLVGLDEARMVVTLHLEDAGEPVADVDHAGVLARTLDHPRRARRQGAQVNARGFVGAVLVPHGRDDAELGQRRLAPDQRQEPLVFVRLQPVLLHELRGNGDIVADHRRRGVEAGKAA